MKIYIITFFFTQIFTLRLIKDEDLQNPLNAEINEKELAKS